MTAQNRGNPRPSNVLRRMVSLCAKAEKLGIKPWEPSPKGQHGFPPAAMASCLVYKTMGDMTYDNLHNSLADMPHLVKSMGLKRVPSKSAFCEAAGRIDYEFFAWAVAYIGRPHAGGTLVGDVTGVGTTVHDVWLDVRYGRVSRRIFVKLHVVMALNRIIVGFRVTDARRGDAPVFEEIFADIPRGRGYVMLDKAYLSRNICTMIAESGRRPVIEAKSNTRPRGFDAMGKMLRWQRDSPEEFKSVYGKRNKVESGFKSIKTAVARKLRARKFSTQRTELAMLALCNNIRCLPSSYS